MGSSRLARYSPSGPLLFVGKDVLPPVGCAVPTVKLVIVDAFEVPGVKNTASLADIVPQANAAAVNSGQV